LVSEPWTKPLIPRKGSPIGGSLLQSSNNYHLYTNPGEKRRRSTIVSATDAKPPIALPTPEFPLLLPRLSSGNVFIVWILCSRFPFFAFFLSSSLSMPILHNKKVFEELGSGGFQREFCNSRFVIAQL
jgi:hypothetical protein